MPRVCEHDGWVEIECVLIEPVDRAPGLPEDTAAQPLKMWVKGFARSASVLGETVEIETMTGRRVTGTLVDVDPGYTHTFGSQPPELAHVGRDLRARVAAYRASIEPDAAGDAR